MWHPQTALLTQSTEVTGPGGEGDKRCKNATPTTTRNQGLASVSRRSAEFTHPFMLDRITPSSPTYLGNGLDTLRQRLRRRPESPMDSIYQPISNYCVRNHIEQQVGKVDLSKEDGASGESHYDAILKSCGQCSPIPMESIFNGIRDVEKIGEGVYGEVYSGTFRFFSQDSWVYKIVAIEGSMIVNGERQKTFAEVLPEIVISQELSKLRTGLNECSTDGFVFMKNARIARGKYPTILVNSWETFHDKYGSPLIESDNDKPDFQKDQLYMVLEYEFAGQDIESLNFKDACQTLSIVLQVSHILAVGECALEFEHRDLHWGNILVENFNSPQIRFMLSGFTLFVPSAGIKAVVIDFTVSRATQESTGKGIYLDLGDDEEQFLGTGDHQFDIYRMMRDYNRNDWSKYCPKSNIFWLHYLANKLFEKGRYSSSSKRNVGHKNATRKLRDFSYAILEYQSAKDFVLSKDCKDYKDFLTECAQ